MVIMDNNNPVKKEDENTPKQEGDQRQEPVRGLPISPTTQALPC
jgi:hypothetical protein